MDIDQSILLRLQKANQTHLISYWDQLDYEQRAILIRDICNLDLDRISQAFENIKDQIKQSSFDHSTNDDKNNETIDDIMEPIPECLIGSTDKASKEQLEYYRREG